MKKKFFNDTENPLEYFPLGLAKEKSFCNRVKEQELLHRNIDAVVHTVLISPRRYGKSSLATKVIEDSKLPYEVIDLFVAKDIKTIEKHIIEGIQHLISKVMTISEQTIKFLQTILNHINAKIVIGTSGVNIEFSITNDDSASNILDALQALDKILSKNKIKAILFIDEFQQIGVLAQGRGIEGAFRHVAQETRNLVFIFSGSNRHMLAHMFHDSNRPFYKLCHEISLKRIGVEDYTKYLNYASQKFWGTDLSAEVTTAILNCVELHPYYMNALCMRIWMYAEKPTQEFVQQVWEEYIFEERSKTINELSMLTTNQYIILNRIAHGYKKQLTGYMFLSETKMPSSSVVHAVDELVKSDYIYKEGEEYHLIDPLIRSSLLLFADENN